MPRSRSRSAMRPASSTVRSAANDQRRALNRHQVDGRQPAGPGRRRLCLRRVHRRHRRGQLDAGNHQLDVRSRPSCRPRRRIWPATITGYTGTTIQAVPLGAHLTWNAVTDTPSAGGTVSYKILRKLTAGGTYVADRHQCDQQLRRLGSDHRVELLLRGPGHGHLRRFAPVRGRFDHTPVLPPTPTNSQITAITDNSISFQWQDNANNENGYLIDAVGQRRHLLDPDDPAAGHEPGPVHDELYR